MNVKKAIPSEKKKFGYLNGFMRINFDRAKSLNKMLNKKIKVIMK